MSERIYIGIDPGKAGCLAVLGDGEPVWYNAPVVKAKRGHDYLPAEMRGLLQPYAGRAVAVLEEAQVPRLARDVGTGNITSAYQIGFGFGLWVMALTALEVPYEIIRPDAWKRAMAIPAGSDKEASRAKAQALFPEVAERLRKGKCRPDVCEALLLAEVARRRFGA
jgi:crossover junction endodeoxyribonuclease RuvC